MGREKILFDTDPGIDDAMALLMLAHDARAQLLGVTTVFGNVGLAQTTHNALALCERFGIDVPVARGAAAPLLREPTAGAPDVHGADGMGDVGLELARRHADARPAHRLICDLARAHEGELVLVSVGPLTNLAQALEHDPSLVHRVKQVVVMGGAFGTRGHSGNVSPAAEANVHNDPHAADRVFTAGWPVRIVGLDVTHEVLMSTAYLDALGRDGGEAGAFIRAITRRYQAFYDPISGGGIYSHDASAVACALDPSAFAWRDGPVRVITDGLAIGQSLQAAGRHAAAPGWAGHPPQQVAVAVQAERLLDEFRALFVGAAPDQG